jgi:hypothetical protein
MLHTSPSRSIVSALRSISTVLVLAAGLVFARLAVTPSVEAPPSTHVARAGSHAAPVPGALAPRLIDAAPTLRESPCIDDPTADAALSYLIEVLDAATGAPLENAQIHAAKTTVRDRAKHEERIGDRLVVRTSRDHLRAAEVARTMPLRRGPSPQRFDLRPGRTIYVTAPGYGLPTSSRSTRLQGRSPCCSSAAPRSGSASTDCRAMHAPASI